MPLFHRKNPRAMWYDYSTGGMYFITTCTQDREEFFGAVQDGEMLLNDIGKVCDEELQIMLQKRLSVEMHEYMIMPNHVHLLFEVDEWTKGANVHISTQITIINQSVGSII
jgi:REP element-mobilizing transposase RayT